MVRRQITELRNSMKAHGINIYVVPTSDYHDSEYVGDYFRAREFLSGFTGSAGTLVVSGDEACLWTDGRYFLQAAAELDGSGIRLMKSGEPGVPRISEYLKSKASQGTVVGYDGRLLSVSTAADFNDAVTEAGGSVVSECDLIDEIWKNRPALSCSKIEILALKYAGEKAADKLARLRREMATLGAESHIITSLDDIAWLLNLRGNDVECNPVFLSYLYIDSAECVLFVQPEALTGQVKQYLKELDVKTEDYNSIYEYIGKLTRGKTMLVDESRLNYLLFKLISERCEPVRSSNPTQLMKACKNKTEQACLRRANIEDGIAMVKFLSLLDSLVKKGNFTELDVCDALLKNRSESENFRGVSFETIAGYGSHGAIIHYEPDKKSNITIEPEGLLLIDSGAQYLTGTTDITRTVAVGPLTRKMKHHYTLVLKSHLSLERLVFKKGCCGANLDLAAREPLWKEHLDYNHGTGHGVGFYLNVHEGPVSFNWNAKRQSATEPVKPGMVITDEPGIYVENEYGIRIENDLLVVPDKGSPDDEYMAFEPLTLCPIDLRPVIVSELNSDEKEMLNRYHALVYKKLSPHLKGRELAWLKKATRRI